MTWKNFQDDAFNLTKKEIADLSKQVLLSYTQARKGIEEDLKKLYLKYLTGIPPEEYYNVIIQRNVLKKNLAQITADYNAYSRGAGKLVEKISRLGISNTYYRKLYAAQWLANDLNFGYLPRSLIELTTFSTQEAWKGIPDNIKKIYGSLDNYTSKAGTLTSFLVNDRQKEVKQIQRAITSGLQQGKSYTSMANDIKGVIGKDTIKDGVRTVTGAKANAMRIVRTEGNRAMNAGSYANSKYDDSEGVEIRRQMLSTLDDRTRAQSASMDGDKVGVDEPFTYPNGAKGMYPGSSGVAKYDINDRETVIDIVGDNGPQIRRGRNPVTGENEVFDYADFDEWSGDNGLVKNKYGEIVGKGDNVINKKAIKRPKTFSLDTQKMKSVKLPKSVKAAGIDSEKYKDWIFKNWT